MKKIIILSLSIDETEIISSKLKEDASVSTHLWDDLINTPIDLEQCDSLIITGTEDHLKNPRSSLNIPNPLLETVKTALMNDIPILGINLGMQIINIALGGKYPKFILLTQIELNQKRKDIFVSPGSKLTTII